MRVETSVVINRPIEEVFKYVSNYENSLDWMAHIVEAETTSEGPVGVGTTFRLVAQLLGPRVQADLEVTAYELNRRFDFKITSGPLPAEVMHTLETVEDGTKLTPVFEAEMGGFFRLAEPLVVRVLKRQVETQFANLKDVLESKGEGSA